MFIEITRGNLMEKDIDNSLVSYLINNYFITAIHKYNLTNDPAELEKNIEYSLKQIDAVKDTDNQKTIEKLISDLKIEKNMSVIKKREKSKGLEKALEILEEKKGLLF